ncbi:hypothetical protein [Streptomyces sp. NPDC093984]
MHGAAAKAATWMREILAEGAPHSSRLHHLRRLQAWLDEGERCASMTVGP